MPGYNHYSDCTCGWCLKDGGSYVDNWRAKEALRRHDAEQFLKRHAVHTLTGCFVAPNAHCPVCGKGVFFYANQHGSRVYFDDLGPPWPKHPCTDNPKHKSISVQALSPEPKRRAAGITRELLREAGLAPFPPPHKSSKGWQLLIATSVRVRKWRHTVQCETLSSVQRSQCTISYLHDDQLIFEGDYISRSGKRLSILEKTTLEPIEFQDGEWISLKPKNEDNKAAQPNPPKPADPKALVVVVTTKVTRSPKLTKADMRADEMIHFHSRAINVADFCRKLEPIIRLYAREMVRKPEEVSARLNADKHWTANGSRWTPRLARFLLALLFNEPKEQVEKPKYLTLKRPIDTGVWSSRNRPVAIEPMAEDTIANKLANLGRVVVKKS